ncbi:uncharacterized protein LOC111703759 [Eurytemora carolleeae]|uniref:uncharacterized protein LOC111703759 n=1 Tax=Eurytemora carolleeae TaxID=1294199 RepID=UPI000C75E3D5|nr:uncharacterized protein LOC111703759 [Eurytemora carolleeae]|eukprot:XP_023331569.1 uncharacterized protein LOC111703759 [Eurytemora affinis]
MSMWGMFLLISQIGFTMGQVFHSNDDLPSIVSILSEGNPVRLDKSLLNNLLSSWNNRKSQEQSRDGKPCSFFTDSEEGEREGRCTNYGACRIEHQDYFSREGACRDFQDTGIHTHVVSCYVKITTKQRIDGICSDRNCRAGSRVRFFHRDCSESPRAPPRIVDNNNLFGLQLKN